MIPLRQARRFYRITRTLLHYGLDELIPWERLPLSSKLARASLFWLRNLHPDKPLAQRFRMALEELGPVHIKFGQMLSTRRDLLPEDYADQLALLQEQVTPFPGDVAMQIAEQALKRPLSDLFDDFDPTPLASASVAQVHTAKLKDDGNGQSVDVVLKIIRPGIDKVILDDLRLMESFANLTERLFPESKRLRPREVVAEYRKTILEELDLRREAANASQLRRNFEDSPILYIPLVYHDLCQERLLVMERIEGVQVADLQGLKEQGTNMQLLAERGVEVFFTQVFRDSFFHADMHPGNIYISREHPEDPLWIALDFGICGTLNSEDKRYLAENFLAFFNRDYRRVAQLHVDSGWVPPDTKIHEFEMAIRTVCDPIFNKPLSEISFGHALINLFVTARRFNMEVQPQLVLLEKTLLYIEGLGRQLYPQLDLWQTAKPFLEDWIKEQMGPKAVSAAVKQNLSHWGEKLPELPDLLYDALKQSRGMDHRLAHYVKRLEGASERRRYSFYLLSSAAALLISSTLLYLHQHFSLSAAGLTLAAGCWIAGWRKSEQ